MPSCLLVNVHVFHAGRVLQFLLIFIQCNLRCPNVHGFADRQGRVNQIIMMPRMKSSTCNVILMRMISSIMKRRHLRDPSDSVGLSLLDREGLPSLHAGGLRPPSFDAATFCVGALAVELLTLQQSALMVPLESPTFLGVSYKWCPILQSRSKP